MRIASLLASGTEIAWSLGLGDDVVAISHECDYPSELLDRPRITRPRFDPRDLDSGEIDAAVRQAMERHGGVYEIDDAALRDARPDLLLTQAVCEVCAVPADDARAVVARMDEAPTVHSLDAHTLDGILETILQVGAAAGVEQRAERCVADLRGRLEAASRAVAGRPRPRVLGLEWLDPPFLPGHWVPEMIEIAGGANLRGRAGARSVEAAWKDLRDLDPDVLVVMPCGYDLDAARRDADEHANRLVELARHAVEAGRAYVVDASSYFNRSGPRVVDGVEILAALLHPGAAPEVDLEGRAAVWAPRIHGSAETSEERA